jgi:hypothetical protein
MSSEPTGEWRFRQAQDRIEQIDRAVVDYGKEFNLPVRRVDAPPEATWTLGARTVARFVRPDAGADRLDVNELGLVGALRRLRLAHVVVEAADLSG